LWIFCFDPNCQEREWEICFCDVACIEWVWFWLVQWWPFIGCHMCIWTNELVPCGLGTACVASWTESEKKGLKCNFGKLRTEMQFHLDCFENNKTETGLFWKLELDTSAIKCKIWTEFAIFENIRTKMQKNSKIG